MDTTWLYINAFPWEHEEFMTCVVFIAIDNAVQRFIQSRPQYRTLEMLYPEYVSMCHN